MKLLPVFLSFIVNESLQVKISVVDILFISYIYRFQIKEPRVRIYEYTYKTKLICWMQHNMKKLHNTPSFLTRGSPHEQSKKRLCVGVPTNANFKNHNSSLKQHTRNTKKETI
jgi:hypothetical protein